MREGAGIIGVIGHVRSGKSIVSRRFYEAGFIRLRFSDPAKAMLRTLGLSHELMDGERRNDPLPQFGNRTPHELVSTLLAWGRDNSSEFWALQYKLSAASLDGLAFTDDIRRPKEVDVIRSLGGAIVRVVRPAVAAGLPESALVLNSCPCDFEIINDGSPRALKEQADAIIAASRG